MRAPDYESPDGDTGRTEADTEALFAEIKKLRADFASVSELVKDLIRDRAGEAVGKGRESAERTWADVKTAIRGVAGEVDRNPVASVATAFGAGLLAGLIVGRRKRSRVPPGDMT